MTELTELTREEVVAMWLFGAEYARCGVSAVQWWKILKPSRRSLVADFIAEYEAAAKRDGVRGSDV